MIHSLKRNWLNVTYYVSRTVTKTEKTSAFVEFTTPLERDNIQNENESVKSLNHVRLCDPMDCSLPGSSVHGILQARIIEWVAIPFPRASSWVRDQTQVSHIVGR